jgi:hypothetical protein
MYSKYVTSLFFLLLFCLSSHVKERYQYFRNQQTIIDSVMSTLMYTLYQLVETPKLNPSYYLDEL